MRRTTNKYKTYIYNLVDLYYYIILGEMVVAEAENVLLFTPVKEKKTGKSGVLFVTNFRLSFVTSHEKHLKVNLK